MASNKAEAPTAWTVIGVAGATRFQGLKMRGVLFGLRVRTPRMTIRFLQPTDLFLIFFTMQSYLYQKEAQRKPRFID